MPRREHFYQTGLFRGICFALFFAGCGGSPWLLPDGSGEEDPVPAKESAIQAAVAVSKHYVRLSLDEPLLEAADPSNFVITGPNSTSLLVAAADIVGEGREIILTTGEQQAVDYRLTIRGEDGTTEKSRRAGKLALAEAIVFKGSTQAEPYLTSAIALSSTSVLATYSGVMDKNIEVAEYYEIAAPDLKVIDAESGPTGTTALLTTSTQEPVRYLLRATNVTSQNGTKLIDPTRSTAPFYGIAVPDLTGPFVVGAVATDDRTVVVSFSEPLSDEAANPQNFSISPSLIIANAELRVFNTQVVLTTLAQVPGAPYTVSVTGVRDKSDNPIAGPPDPGSQAVFRGGGAPFLTGAVSLSNSESFAEVLLTFSEVVETASAQTLASYWFSPSLTVQQATVQASDARTVLIRTSTQQPVEYEVTASHIRSGLDGSYMDPERNTASFFGLSIPDHSRPKVTAAVATSSSSVLVSFSEPLADDAGDPTRFSIANPELAIVAAELSPHRTQVTLQTLLMTAGQTYTVVAGDGVKDRSGNSIADSPDNEQTFVFSGQGNLADVLGLPWVVGAASLGNTSVIVSFSKPMADSALDPASYAIVQTDVNPEAGALPVVFGERVRDGGNGRVDTEAEGDDIANFGLGDTVTPRTVIIRAGDNNVIDSTLGGDDAVEILPAPRFASLDRTAVILTTMQQNEVTYQVTVVNVKDMAGNPLASPELFVEPSQAKFRGTPASPGGGLPQDSDGDGLPDNVEIRGWMVTIVLADDQVQQYEVTSDPFLVDTDGDGLTDFDERGLHTSPRLADTDYDTVNDSDEYNIWYSDPTRQDSDGDGLHDALEIGFFYTSPILADSDGDQMNDSEELFERNRNPLLSDLPVPQITVGSIRLDVKVTSSFTDEEGTSTETTDSASTSFAQSRSDTLGTSSTTSTEAENKFSQEIGFELGGSVKDGFAGKVTGKAGFEQTRSQGYSSTVDRETAKASQQEWQRSVSKAMSESQNRSVTRSIDSAIVQAAVNLANRSDIAFSITNLELSVLQQDRLAGRNFQPIATLRPSSDDTPTFNLGPLDGERGPIIFESVNVFPNLVESLMREPTGLVFKVVNYDILDEFGRNFAFSSQEVVERTAGIEIDFGGGVVEKYRVATTNSFDENGRPLGITLQRALEIAGFAKMDGDDSALTVPSPLTPEIRKSYGVIVTAAGVERLTRIRGVQKDFSTNLIKRTWAVVISNEDVSEDTHFSEIPVFAGDTIQLWYTSDADKDGLFAREEFLYGSSDDDDDSDGDGLLDFFEVRTGWSVNRVPGLPYKVFPDPARTDSDLDGLTDQEEFTHGTDPHRADTDEDGVSDYLEINGPVEVILYDGDADETNDVILLIQPYERAHVGIVPANGLGTPAGDDRRATVISPGPDGIFQSFVAGDDVLIRHSATSLEIDWGADGNLNSPLGGDDTRYHYIYPGPNGVLDTQPDPGEYISVAHARLFATDPLNRDTDSDGLPDGRELIVGANPNSSDAGRILDSDNDGLSDDEETTGWLLAGTTVRVTSNPLRADTDLDGLPDVFERAIGSNPRSRDTDGDTLSDLQEFDPADQDNYYSDAAMEDALRRCQAASACVEPAAPATALRTSINKADSDGDSVNDDIELTRTWFVSAVGPDGTPLASVEVSSKPYRADDDGDGLNDAEEFAYQTHPGEADSDTDGTDDGDETVTCTVGIPAVCRDPLVADRLLTFEFTNFVTIDDCDDSGYPNAEISKGFLYFVAPGVPETSYQIPGTLGTVCVGEDTNHTGGDDGTILGNVALSFSRTFFLKANQTFTVRNDPNMTECDAGSEDPLAPTSVVFDYADVAGLSANVQSTPAETFVINAAPNAEFQGTGCQFQVLMKLTSIVTSK